MADATMLTALAVEVESLVGPSASLDDKIANTLLAIGALGQAPLYYFSLVTEGRLIALPYTDCKNAARELKETMLPDWEFFEKGWPKTRLC